MIRGNPRLSATIRRMSSRERSIWCVPSVLSVLSVPSVLSVLSWVRTSKYVYW